MNLNYKKMLVITFLVITFLLMYYRTDNFTGVCSSNNSCAGVQTGR